MLPRATILYDSFKRTQKLYDKLIDDTSLAAYVVNVQDKILYGSNEGRNLLSNAQNRPGEGIDEHQNKGASGVDASSNECHKAAIWDKATCYDLLHPEYRAKTEALIKQAISRSTILCMQLSLKANRQTKANTKAKPGVKAAETSVSSMSREMCAGDPSTTTSRSDLK